MRALIVICLLAFALPAHADESSDSGQPEVVEKLSLRTLVDKAIAASYEVRGEQGKVTKARADLRRAEMARWVPEFRLRGLAGPSPEINCNYPGDPGFEGVQPTIGECISDQTNLADPSRAAGTGVFGRVEIDVAQPVWDFGKVSGLINAAESGIEAARMEVLGKEMAVAHRTAEIYWGLQLAREALEIIDEIDKRLGEARETLDKRLEEGDGTLSQIDRQKLKLFATQIDLQRLDVVRRRDEALRALEFTLGVGVGEVPAFEDAGLKGKAKPPPEVDLLVREAQIRRPDLKRAVAGVAAFKAQADSERSRYFPQLIVAGRLRYAKANNRDEPRSPWIGDPLNVFITGIGIGIEQELALHRVWADVKKKDAETAELQTQSELLRRSVALDVQRAHNNAAAAATKVNLVRKARKAGRAWMTSASRNFDLGLGSLKAFIDGYSAYVGGKQDHLEAQFDYRLALLRLRAAVGMRPTDEFPSPAKTTP